MRPMAGMVPSQLQPRADPAVSLLTETGKHLPLLNLLQVLFVGLFGVLRGVTLYRQLVPTYQLKMQELNQQDDECILKE